MLLSVTTQPVVVGYSAVEVLSIAASVASVLLAIVAIGLTMMLYRMSNQVSSDTKESVGTIKSNVAKLDELFREYHAKTMERAQRFEDRTLTMLEGRQPTTEEAAAQEAKRLEQQQRLVEEAMADLSARVAAAAQGQEKTEAVLADVREALVQVAERTREAAEEGQQTRRQQQLLTILARRLLVIGPIEDMTLSGLSTWLNWHVEEPVALDDLLSALRELHRVGALQRPVGTPGDKLIVDRERLTPL